MTFIPPVRKRPRMMPPKESAPISCPGHKPFVRKRECCVKGRLHWPNGSVIECEGPIEFHHSKTVGAGGGDETGVPLCSFHHRLLDSPGWSQRKMELMAGVSFEAIAAALWKLDTYHRLKWEAEHKMEVE